MRGKECYVVGDRINNHNKDNGNDIMKVNLVGRISNIDLKVGDVLLPMFDAIINSIEAINDAIESGVIIKGEGKIKITIERDTKQLQFGESTHSYFPIESFIIEDNGIGFDEQNFNSFNTSDSRYKSDRGGKGVGRFLWLKAFNEVHIESVFKNGTETLKREFDFILSDEEINAPATQSHEKNTRTKVYLKNLKQKYQKACPIKIETIANKVIEHCLFYFLQNDCPIITLADDDSTLTLNEIYRNVLIDEIIEEEIDIHGEIFQIIHLKLKKTGNDHMIHYCAKGRDVKEEKVHKKIPNLINRIEDEEKSFIYEGYIFGEYLDNHVNSTRTEFCIPVNTEIDTYDELTFEELNNSVIENIRKYLQIFIEKIDNEKKKRIKEYIHKKAFEYRPIIKHFPIYLENISPDVSDDELEIELHKIRNIIEIDTKKEASQILSENPILKEDRDEYEEKVLKIFERINDIGKAELSKYIVQRKVMIDIFLKGLKRDDEGKYNYEKVLHEIIFPLGTTSDDLSLDKQNLWLIDERLAYHLYLASDKTIKSSGLVDSNSTKEPDILIFNNSFLLVGTDQPYTSIVIIEFKRPQRDDYSDTENPILQIQKYIEDINHNTAKDKDGRPIQIQRDIPFYAYIIADITPSLEKYTQRMNLIRTPDNIGYYGYMKNYHLYIEIISYDKLISNAKKRNRILFDKLQLPYN